jgi:50S ribosomal protein L16 3-hydroxylase
VVRAEQRGRARQNRGMDVNTPLPLLGGLSAQQFMRRHWQKKPLLVRQAWPGVQPPVTRAQAFALAAHEDMESRLVVQRQGQWTLKRGPLSRRSLPPLSQPGWTLLLQGLDLFVPAAHDMLQRFRFVPDARLDDLMLSWASDAGGVGPHTDAYDVFLLQVHGSRRWRVGRTPNPQWVPDTPLKRLAHFEAQHDWLLQPGDMLYLPPHWGHDGVAEGGDCMTCSIGFRTPSQDELAREVLQRLAEETEETEENGQESGAPGPAATVRSRQARHYRDPDQPATAHPAAMPAALQSFAQEAVARCLAQPHALARVLGEWATEPKPQVWFERLQGDLAALAQQGVRLHARSRMMYDTRHVFINGEALLASGRDARLMRRLADTRALGAADVHALTPAALDVLMQWLADGWLTAEMK